MYIYDGRTAGGRLGDSPSSQESRLKELAKWPEKAHLAWKGLGTDDRRLVIMQMVANYGSEFAKSFMKTAGTKTPKDLVDRYYGRGVGPKPQQLLAGGYRLAQQDSVNQWWVHPSGVSVTRNYSVDAAGQQAPPPRTTSKRSPSCELKDITADHRCRYADSVCEFVKRVNDARWQPQCDEARDACDRVRQSARECRD